ncbi:hypothetical protein OK074_8779 [Actinobacteria bacterium OK074]|nr:hypothetical protein OK074_8779 [Actinobacteria bacterium OK074]
MVHTVTPAVVPLPRRPPAPEGPVGTAATANTRPPAPDAVRRWYENELGWPTVPGSPVRLPTGVAFDVLDVPARAGRAALRHLRPHSPVALRADRMWFLVAAGGADEVPGLLDWLEWGALAADLLTDLRALGTAGHVEAPVPPDAYVRDGLGAGGPGAGGPGAGGPTAGVHALGTRSQGAAVWLRPPGPGYEARSSLPAVSAVGGGGDAPDLVRLVETVANHCHRIRLRRTDDRSPACSQYLPGT